MQSNPKDDGVTIGATTVSVKCPVSGTFLDEPMRGPHCEHFAAFGKDAYLNMVREAWRVEKKEIRETFDLASKAAQAVSERFARTTEARNLTDKEEELSRHLVVMDRFWGTQKIVKRHARYRIERCPICQNHAPPMYLLQAADVDTLLEDAREYAEEHPDVELSSLLLLQPASWKPGLSPYSQYNPRELISSPAFGKDCRHAQAFCSEALSREQSDVSEAHADLVVCRNIVIDMMDDDMDDEDLPRALVDLIERIDEIIELLCRSYRALCQCPVATCKKSIFAWPLGAVEEDIAKCQVDRMLPDADDVERIRYAKASTACTNFRNAITNRVKDTSFPPWRYTSTIGVSPLSLVSSRDLPQKQDEAFMLSLITEGHRGRQRRINDTMAPRRTDSTAEHIDLSTPPSTPPRATFMFLLPKIEPKSSTPPPPSPSPPPPPPKADIEDFIIPLGRRSQPATTAPTPVPTPRKRKRPVPSPSHSPPAPTTTTTTPTPTPTPAPAPTKKRRASAPPTTTAPHQQRSKDAITRFSNDTRVLLDQFWTQYQMIGRAHGVLPEGDLEPWVETRVKEVLSTASKYIDKIAGSVTTPTPEERPRPTKRRRVENTNE